MEYFQDFVLVKNLYNKHNVKVDVVKPRVPNSFTPELYVVKTLKIGRALREADIHKELSDSNPSILKYYCGWKKDQYQHHCIEYCEQNSLHSFLTSSEKLSFEKVLNFCTQIAENLKILHDKQICHRDIKALNIFITNDWKLKIGDFGASKRVEIDKNEPHTIIGTEPYLSPELFKKLKKCGDQMNNPYRDDIWALGKTFLEIFIGRILIDFKNVVEIHKFIDKELQFDGSLDPFVFLLKRMICDEKSDYIEINLVLSELRLISERIYNESIQRFRRDPEDLTLDLNCFYGVESLQKKECESNAKIDLIRSEEKNEIETVINKAECSINGDQFIISESFPSESITKKIKCSISGDLKSFIPDSTGIKNEESKHSNQIEEGKKKFESYNEDDSILANFDYLEKSSNEILASDQLINSNKYTECTDKQNSFEISNIQSFNISPNPKIPKIVPLKPELDTCSICSLSITNDKIKINCGHFYHANCFLGLFEKKLKKANKKVHFFKCLACDNPIHFETFFEIKKFSHQARKNSYLQMLAHTNFICPICSVSSENHLLNRKLDFYDVICEICTSRFCSFCYKRGSHYFTCDDLKKMNFKDSK